MRTKGDMIVYALEHTKDKDLLGFFCAAVRGGTIVCTAAPEQALLEWLAERIDRDGCVVPSRGPDKRLMLTPEKKAERDLRLTRAVLRLADRGLNLDDAYDHVAAAERPPIGRDTVRKAYNKYGRQERMTFERRVYEYVHEIPKVATRPKQRPSAVPQVTSRSARTRSRRRTAKAQKGIEPLGLKGRTYAHSFRDSDPGA